jgi:hypothetical protein
MAPAARALDQALEAVEGVVRACAPPEFEAPRMHW